jgi:hypothetical protein
MNVNPVQQRTGNFIHIILDFGRVAAAGPARVGIETARASVMNTMTIFAPWFIPLR